MDEKERKELAELVERLKRQQPRSTFRRIGESRSSDERGVPRIDSMFPGDIPGRWNERK